MCVYIVFVIVVTTVAMQTLLILHLSGHVYVGDQQLHIAAAVGKSICVWKLHDNSCCMASLPRVVTTLKWKEMIVQRSL